MNFDFLMKNLTDDKMKISYVVYFPVELESYYLSRSKIELYQVDLKPNQVVNATQSMLVALEECYLQNKVNFYKKMAMLCILQFLLTAN